jgi:uroporphyrinogen decarboxylase
MYHHPRAWHRMLQVRKSPEIICCIRLKRCIGGSMFDSWVGASRKTIEYVLPYSKLVLAELPVPCIHFSTGTSSYLDLVAEAGGDVISIDWRIRLSEAWKQVPDRAIQGNMDPACLLQPPEQLKESVRSVLREAGGARPYL